MPATRAVVGVVLATCLTSVVLAGCTSPDPEPTRSVSTSTPEPSETPEPDPVPVFDGTAEENQEFFDYSNRALIDSGAALSGTAFVENLVLQGYPREAMEVTPDSTAIGLGADNVVFSIRFGEQCLLGQWGNIGYTSLVTEVLSTGRCIVGTPRPA